MRRIAWAVMALLAVGCNQPVDEPNPMGTVHGASSTASSEASSTTAGGGIVSGTDGGGAPLDPNSPSCDLDRLMRAAQPSGAPPTGWGTDAPTAALGQLASEMVGHWRGSRTTEWDGEHPVELAFFADGSYSAATLDGVLPLYYGEYCADHRTWWRLDTGDATQAAGELRIFFELVFTSTVEEIRHVRLSGDRLSFDQWHFDQYGPIHFELHRVP